MQNKLKLLVSVGANISFLTFSAYLPNDKHPGCCSAKVHANVTAVPGAGTQSGPAPGNLLRLCTAFTVSPASSDCTDGAPLR